MPTPPVEVLIEVLNDNLELLIEQQTRIADISALMLAEALLHPPISDLQFFAGMALQGYMIRNQFMDSAETPRMLELCVRSYDLAEGMVATRNTRI